MICRASIFCLLLAYADGLSSCSQQSALAQQRVLPCSDPSHATRTPCMLLGSTYLHKNCRTFASSASLIAMGSDADPPLPNSVETSLLPLPEHDRLFLLPERGSKRIKECDVKTLAARQKRTEIRRLKLIAAAHEKHDAEPSPKRVKLAPQDVSGFNMHGALAFISKRGCKLDGLIGVCKPNMGDFETMNLVARVGVPQEQGADKDEDGGAGLQNRLAVSGDDRAGPSHCVVSICGRSRVMEDAAIAVPSFLTMPSLAVDHAGGSVHTDTFHFFGVYDGHGGPQAAEICKEKMHWMLAKEMSTAAYSSPSHLEECMQTCFRRIDDELCGVCPHGSECPRKTDVGRADTNSKCREPLVLGSVGTTAVVAVVGTHHIVVGNCGDSRAVLCRAGKAVPLSLDHKADRPDEVARIEAAGGHVFSWEGHRVCGVLAMSRALGDGNLKPFVSGEPEVMTVERTDDDDCLILASDGLWDKLNSKYVCRLARTAMANWRRQHKNFQDRYPLFAHRSEDHEFSSKVDAEDSPAEVVAAMLVKLALARNSKDNISVVVIDLKRL